MCSDLTEQRLQEEIEYMHKLLSPLDIPVELPPSLQGEAMLQKLRALEARENVRDTDDVTQPFFESIEGNPAIADGKVIRFTPVVRWVSAIAAVFLVALCVVRYGHFQQNSSIPSNTAQPSETTEISPQEAGVVEYRSARPDVMAATSYGMIGSVLDSTSNEPEAASAVPQMAMDETGEQDGGNRALSAAAADSPYTIEFTQSDSDYLYTLQSNALDSQVCIIDTSSMALCSTIELPTLYDVEDMVLREDLLLLVGTVQMELPADSQAAQPFSALTAGETNSTVDGDNVMAVRATIYDVSDHANPVVKTIFEQSGRLLGVEMVDGYLHLFSQQWAVYPAEDEVSAARVLPVTRWEEETPQLVPAENILVDGHADLDSYTVISLVPLETAKRPVSQALLGNVQSVSLKDNSFDLLGPQNEGVRLLRFGWVDGGAVYKNSTTVG